MTAALVLNAGLKVFPGQIRTLGAFMKTRLQGLTADLTIVLSDSTRDLAEIRALTSTPRGLLIHLPSTEPETALAALARAPLDQRLLLFPAGPFGAEVAVRLATRLGGAALIGVTSARLAEGRLQAEKRVYSQHLEAIFTLNRTPACLSLAPGLDPAEPPPPGEETAWAELDFRSLPVSPGARQLTPLAERGGLSQARRLVVGGLGLGGAEGVEALTRLAEALGAEWGGSRAAALRAWLPMSRLVGVSGAMTRPELCLTLGASGAAAFFAGIEKSRFIVSINQDPRAPVISRSDVAVIADWRSIVPQLLKLVTGEKK